MAIEKPVNGELIRLQHGVVIYDENGNIVSSFGAGAGGATAAKQDQQTAVLETIEDDAALSNTLLGGLGETAPGTDTASSGLNGRLQRIAQRITSLIALFPASIGQKAKAASLAVTLASDEDSLASLGAPSGAAVVTDVNGTLQQYLRGLVKMAAAGTINVRTKNGASFDIPQFDYQAFTYVGATNNVATQVFKSGGSGGTTVATLTFAYVAAGAVDDDLIASITQS